MTGHQLLRFRREGLRLGLVRRRLGLGQQGAHLGEHWVVEWTIVALIPRRPVGPGWRQDRGREPRVASNARAATTRLSRSMSSADSMSMRSPSQPVAATRSSAIASICADHCGWSVDGSRRSSSAWMSADTIGASRGSRRRAWRASSLGCQPRCQASPTSHSNCCSASAATRCEVGGDEHIHVALCARRPIAMDPRRGPQGLANPSPACRAVLPARSVSTVVSHPRS